jgi:hypothetical protein
MTRATWLASQVEIDYLRLLADLERYGYSEADAGRKDVAAGVVRLRGRLVALLEGDDARLLRQSFEAEIDTAIRPLLAAVETLKAELESLDRSDPAGFDSKASTGPIRPGSIGSATPSWPMAPACTT